MERAVPPRRAFRRIRREATCGIAAPIWSKASAIARRAIRRATRSARRAAGAVISPAAVAEGWEAPPLNGASPAPIPWSEEAFYDYLRTGYSAVHGVAGGPMAPVVAELKALPDGTSAPWRITSPRYRRRRPSDAELKIGLENAAKARANDPAYLAGARIYQGACAVCHEPGKGAAMFGVRPSLALTTAIHADAPDTVVRVILEGFRAPEGLEGLGAMPAFLHHLDNAQVADLATYLRARFAPDRQSLDKPRRDRRASPQAALDSR